MKSSDRRRSSCVFNPLRRCHYHHHCRHDHCHLRPYVYPLRWARSRPWVFQAHSRIMSLLCCNNHTVDLLRTGWSLHRHHPWSPAGSPSRRNLIFPCSSARIPVYGWIGVVSTLRCTEFPCRYGCQLHRCTWRATQRSGYKRTSDITLS